MMKSRSTSRSILSSVCPVCVDKDKRLFTADSPAWREFCETTLKFRIPEDLAFAYAESGN